MLSLDKKYFQRLIESSPDIIIAVDKSGTVNYYNDGARTSLGYSSEEIIGERCTRIYPSIDEARRVMKAMRASVDTGRIASFETEFRNKDGEIIPVMISGSLIHDDDGNEIGSIGFARDIRRMRHRAAARDRRRNRGQPRARDRQSARSRSPTTSTCSRAASKPISPTPKKWSRTSASTRFATASDRVQASCAASTR